MKRFDLSGSHLRDTREEEIIEKPDGYYVLFEDANAAIEAREEIAENLRGEIRDISAESAKFEMQATQLRIENESLEILLKNLRVEINALREG